MLACWSPDPKCRPSFEHLKLRLYDEYIEHIDDSNDSLSKEENEARG